MAGSKVIKNIIILSNIPLSDKKGASFSRIVEYAKGITTFKNNRVYIASLNHNYHEKMESIGTNNQVFLLGQKVEIKSHFIYDKFLNFSSRKKEFLKILEITKGLEGKAIFLLYPFFNTWYEESYYINKLRHSNYKIFSERNERALGVYLNNSSHDSIIKKLLSLLLSPIEYLNAIKQDELVARYDGNIVISTNFEMWIVKRNRNTIRIPILGCIDVSKKRQIIKKATFNVGYAGTISYKKDGIGMLLKAINILVNNFDVSDIELNIFGLGNKTEIKRMLEDIQKLNLSKYVTYHGFITRKEVEEVLQEQNLLVLIRDSTLQSNFGLSTKLAEYIAARVPVLVTDVSDNKLFLEDKVSAYITKYSAEEIAKSIVYMRNDNISIVENATKVFNENFKIDVYRNKLNDFLN